MRELFDVRFEADGSFDMHLANGRIKVPGAYGCYVLSTGCGTGKTECCKSIIRQCHHQGILYCVDTIVELDKMYEWILSERNSIGITDDDVIIISSDPRHEYFLRQYQNNPEIVMTKKIVLITHVRFWTDLINYFLIYRPQFHVTAFNGDFQSLMSRPDLRQFVIFDETPKFIQPFFKIPRAVLGVFAEKKAHNKWEYLSIPEIREKYNLFIKDTGLDPFPSPNTKINRLKRDVIINLIPQYFTRWCNSGEDELKITFTPIQLAQQQVNTRVMILEGAGNVLFRNSRDYALLDLSNKYNCRLSLQQFPFTLKRREPLNKDAYDTFLSWLMYRIEWNQQYGVKTLAVVWKNQGEKSASSKDSNFYEHIKATLASNLGLSQNMYDVIYYGSAESKSTNRYRDYKEIILAGDWNITNSETSKFNSHFGVNIDSKHHKLWAFIQLLSRIGIRLHDGQEYSVCYSSDFSQGFISNLCAYITNDMVTLSKVKKDTKNWLQELLEKGKIRSNFRSELEVLMSYDSKIEDHLRRNERYYFAISLDQ